MSRLNTFNRIAAFYDIAAFLVFGTAIRKAQLHFLSAVPSTGNILILGGGTGWIAEAVLRNSASKIVYVEASDKMISIARKKLKAFLHRVQFVHGTEADIGNEHTFEAVITNFYLDLFSDASLPFVVEIIRARIKETGVWLVTDFVARNWWHKRLLRLMYSFFRITSAVTVSKLPAWEAAITAAGCQGVAEKFFYAGFIRSAIYRNH
jgi:tRNA (cmo5U34)-methyltransferase